MYRVKTVDIGRNEPEIEVGRVISCPHFQLLENPLLSPVPNVGITGLHSFVLVVEERSIKLVCWTCLKKLPISVATES